MSFGNFSSDNPVRQLGGSTTEPDSSSQSASMCSPSQPYTRAANMDPNFKNPIRLSSGRLGRPCCPPEEINQSTLARAPLTGPSGTTRETERATLMGNVCPKADSPQSVAVEIMIRIARAGARSSRAKVSDTMVPSASTARWEVVFVTRSEVREIDRTAIRLATAKRGPLIAPRRKKMAVMVKDAPALCLAEVGWNRGTGAMAAILPREESAWIE